jgi:hypothetical protein
MERKYDVNVTNLAVFGGLTFSVVAMVATIYGLMYGFGNLSTSVVGASKVMVAAFNQPQPMPQQVPQYIPQNAPVAAQPGQQFYAQPYQQPVAAQQNIGGVTGQFLCPQHGAVGLPNYATNGAAICPICGQPMQLNCPPQQAPLTTVAAVAG